MTDWVDLRDRVCVVTGAGSGIGAATARTLASRGAAVALLDVNLEAAAAVAQEINEAGGRSISTLADVSDEKAIATAGELVRSELGLCDVLINNAAAAGIFGTAMHIDWAAWARVLEINVTGALICTQVFGRQMIEKGRGGSIVAVASICGHLPLVAAGPYSVSKASLMMLSRLLAVELAEHGIRCNTVSPGLVRTGGTEVVYQDARVLEGCNAMVPVGRVADATDIADVIAFLVSERSRYFDGQDLLIDGAIGQTLMGLIPHP